MIGNGSFDERRSGLFLSHWWMESARRYGAGKGFSLRGRRDVDRQSTRENWFYFICACSKFRPARHLYGNGACYALSVIPIRPVDPESLARTDRARAFRTSRSVVDAFIYKSERNRHQVCVRQKSDCHGVDWLYLSKRARAGGLYLYETGTHYLLSVGPLDPVL